MELLDKNDIIETQRNNTIHCSEKEKHQEETMKQEPEGEEESKEEVENMEIDDDGNDESNEDDDESGISSSGEETVELMVTTREKRSNAGNKMAQLLESAEQEDEFYKNTYDGGFLEDDVDDAFESPVESDHDEVDSDFDRPEEDEPISDAEDEPKRRKRKTGYKEPKLGGNTSKKALLEKNKKWVMARMGCLTAAANTVSPETQAQYLEEAKETERKNVASLKKYEQFELEKKKKREKTNVIRKLKPPYISTVDGPDGKWVIVPDIKKFVKPERVVKLLCCVTSRPAKYRDPLTGLPYATPEAFKLIREKYAEYLKSMPNHPAVKSWLAKKH